MSMFHIHTHNKEALVSEKYCDIDMMKVLLCQSSVYVIQFQYLHSWFKIRVM